MEFVKCLGHPEEFYNLVRFRIGGKRKVMPKMDQQRSLHILSGSPSSGHTGR
ncbi:FDFT1 isoform 11 [Pan troglodytes]|uniref:FDFT1 isoform 19 n=5 Tax=Hominidae TaxID=9604 RepID=A0A2J8X3H8_PONAB|nr:FDFT1 isoform 11 [Pan troglodytes]PNJ76589.1 FDFT1 isoform 19 [Pongo abelii]